MELENNYATDIRKARRKGSGGTQEFFTPESLVKKMCDKISDEDWADPKKTYLEPCFGDGNFLVEMIRRRIAHGVDWKTTLKTMYGLELMSDNVQEMKDRVLNMLLSMNLPDFDSLKALKIMNKNFVCSDFFKWDFENWCPLEKPKQYVEGNLF